MYICMYSTYMRIHTIYYSGDVPEKPSPLRGVQFCGLNPDWQTAIMLMCEAINPKRDRRYMGVLWAGRRLIQINLVPVSSLSSHTGFVRA